MFDRPLRKHQSLHAVDAGWDMRDEVVTQVQFPQLGQIGERSRQRDQLVVCQTQNLKTEPMKDHELSSVVHLKPDLFLLGRTSGLCWTTVLILEYSNLHLKGVLIQNDLKIITVPF